MAVYRYCIHLLTMMTVAAVVQIPAAAKAQGCHKEQHSIMVNGSVHVYDVVVCPPATSGSEGQAEPAVVAPTDSGLDPLCVATAMSNGVDPFAFCAPPPNGESILLSPGLIATALARIPLPPSALKVQPPNGRTLVNFDTNFFTETQPFDRTVTLLRQRVDLHIVPSRFGWQFGDGESLTTAEPGAPYPRLDVTHRYLEKGRVAPSVDTTYTARFRVNGGPWRDVPGSVTIAGPPVDLAVLTATPTLVGYN
jgi:hypothetical protein